MDLWTSLSVIYTCLIVFVLHSGYTLTSARSIRDVIKSNNTGDDVTTENTHGNPHQNKTVLNKTDQAAANSSDISQFSADKNISSPLWDTDMVASSANGSSGNRQSSNGDDVTSAYTSSVTLTSQADLEKSSTTQKNKTDKTNDRLQTIRSGSSAVLIMLLSLVVIVALFFTLFGLFVKAEAHTKSRTSYRNGLLCDNRESHFPLQATTLFYDSGEF